MGPYTRTQFKLVTLKCKKSVQKNPTTITSIANYPSLSEIGSDDKPDAYFKKKYPGLSKMEATKTLVAQFKKDYAEFRQSSLGKMFSRITNGDVMYPRDIIDKIDSGADVGSDDLKELISLKSSLVYMTAAYGQGVKIQGVDYEDLKSRIGSSSNIMKVIEKPIKERLGKPSDVANGKSRCIGNYRRNMLILPSGNQLASLKEEIQKVKDKVQEKWASKYSKETRKKIVEYLERVDFALPPSKEEHTVSLKNRIQRKTQDEIRNASLDIKDRETLAFFLAATTYSNSFNQSAYNNTTQGEYGSFCDKDTFPVLNDANYTLQDKIQVSYTTAQAIEMGRGVLAHELGHGISQIFQAKKASDQSSKRQKTYFDCLASLHNKKGEDYAEEDFADWVSANVTQINKVCLYPPYYSTGNKLVDSPETGEFAHSSSFFRLMHVESIQKGKVADECNQLMVDQSTPKDFLTCQRQLVDE